MIKTMSNYSWVSPKATHFCTKSFKGILGTVGAFLILSLSAHAQNWKNPSGGNWTTGTNWVGNTAPVSGSATTLKFTAGNSINYTATDDFAGIFLLNSITFNPGSSSTVTIGASGGSSLEFTGTNPFMTTGSTLTSQIINAPVILGADTTMNGNGLFGGFPFGGITLTGGVSGSSGLIINGLTTLSTTQATYTGQTTINGTLSESSIDMLSHSSAIAVNSGGYLAVYQNQTIGVLTGTGKVISRGFSPTVNTLSVGVGDVSSTFDGTMIDFNPGQDTLALTKIGAGTLTLTGANTYSGPTTISDGALNAVDGVGLSILSNLDLNGGVLESTGTFTRALGTGAGQVQWDPTGTGGGFSALGSALTVNIGGNATPSTLVWGTTPSFIGANQSLLFGSTTADSQVNFENNIDLGTTNLPRTILVNPGQTGSNALLSGVLSGGTAGGTSLVVGDSTHGGTLILTGANTYAGDTDFVNGTLVVGTDTALGVGGTLIVDGTGTNVLTTIATTSNPTLVTLANDVTLNQNLTIQTGVVGSNPSVPDLEIDGVIQGAGGLTKAGTGQLILTGANTYAGDTDFVGGTLAVGADTALGGGTLIVDGAGANVLTTVATVSNPTLVTIANDVTLNQDLTIQTGVVGSNPSVPDLEIDGAIQGTGGLTKAGTGQLTLAGNNTFGGDLQMQAGTLIVGNSHALGSGNVLFSGGTLKTDGVNHVIGVAGNYTQSAGTTLHLEATGAGLGQHDYVNVTKNASLDGTLDVTFTSFVPTTPLLVLQTGGTVSGKFADFTDNLPPSIPLQLIYNSNSVYLSQLFFGQVSGLTPNQTHVANYIDTYDTVVTTGPFTTVVNALSALSSSPGQLGVALDQLSPQKLQVFSKIAFNNATFTTQGLDNHLANLRYGETGWDTSGLTLNDPSVDGGLAQIKSRLLAWEPPPTGGLLSDVSNSLVGGIRMTDPKDLKAMREAPPVTDTNRWDTFVQGDVVLADLSHTTDLEHSKYTTGSVEAGADYRLTDHWTAGALFGYGHTDATLDSQGSSVTADTYSPGVYAGYQDHGWYANGLFSYGHNVYSEARRILVPGIDTTATGSPEGNQYVGNLDGGYEFHDQAWTYGPSAGLQYVHLDVDGFSETGAGGANLNVSHQETDSLRSRLGGEVRYHTMWWSKVAFNPHLSAYWQHEFMDASHGITSQFSAVGAGSFSVATDQPDRDSALIDVGFDAQLDNLTFFVDYQTEAGQENFFAQSIQSGFRIAY